MNIEKKLTVLSILAAVTSPSVLAMPGQNSTSDEQTLTAKTAPAKPVRLSLYGPVTIIRKQKPTGIAEPEVETEDENQKLLEEANREVKNLRALLRQAEDQAIKNETALTHLAAQLTAAQEEAEKSKKLEQGCLGLWGQIKTIKNSRMQYKQKFNMTFDLLSKHYEKKEEEEVEGE